jgi:hypothetical protein
MVYQEAEEAIGGLEGHLRDSVSVLERDGLSELVHVDGVPECPLSGDSEELAGQSEIIKVQVRGEMSSNIVKELVWKPKDEGRRGA